MRLCCYLYVFLELSCAEISKKWERWDEADIDRFRIQFQIIDANEDGMIDFDELYVACAFISIDCMLYAVHS